MESTQQADGQKVHNIVLEQRGSVRLPATFLLILEAYLALVRFDLYLAHREFEPLYEKVRKYPTAKRTPQPGSVQIICSAIDMACIWYRKEVLCLQRSAATVCLLRKYGISAHLVIGAQQMPFRAHAWAEVGGKVVNDKQYVGELYATLDRC